MTTYIVTESVESTNIRDIRRAHSESSECYNITENSLFEFFLPMSLDISVEADNQELFLYIFITLNFMVQRSHFFFYPVNLQH